jgi:hypothetical protein
MFKKRNVPVYADIRNFLAFPVLTCWQGLASEGGRYVEGVANPDRAFIPGSNTYEGMFALRPRRNPPPTAKNFCRRNRDVAMRWSLLLKCFVVG